MKILLDFDGVLYPGGQCKFAEDLELDPIPHSIQWLTRLTYEHEVYIWTARLCQSARYSNFPVCDAAVARDALYQWLYKYGADIKRIHIVMPWEGKPPVDLYIDDHAFRWKGDYDTVPGKLDPWWRT